MSINKPFFCWLVIVVLLASCGGGAKQPQAAAPVAVTPPSLETAAAPGAPCTQPIASPGEVWKRVEEVRALPENELVTTCGLSFVEALSDWRCPPVDLLRPIVLSEGQNKAKLVEWATQKAKAGKKAAVHAAAMDILGDWKIGDDPASLATRENPWKPLADQFSGFETLFDELADLQAVLTELKEIHQLRCMLEVNPLGFAVSCTPIHPPREKIDLTWKEEMQDGLIQSIALTKCKGSRSCKKLQSTALTFAGKYQAAKVRAEALKTDVFREQALEWLKLPPFSQAAR